MTRSENARRLRIDALGFGVAMAAGVAGSADATGILPAPDGLRGALPYVAATAGFAAACALHGLLLGTLANELVTCAQLAIAAAAYLLSGLHPEILRRVLAGQTHLAAGLVVALTPALGMAAFGCLRLLWRLTPLTHDFYDSRFFYDDVTDDPPSGP